MWVIEMAKTVSDIFKWSPTNFVFSIRHQHRCIQIACVYLQSYSVLLRMNWDWIGFVFLGLQFWYSLKRLFYPILNRLPTGILIILLSVLLNTVLSSKILRKKILSVNPFLELWFMIWVEMIMK